MLLLHYRKKIQLLEKSKNISGMLVVDDGDGFRRGRGLARKDGAPSAGVLG
jgi:hypothetical protein